MNPLLNLYTKLPNLKGKNWLGQKWLNQFHAGESAVQQIHWGFSIQLRFADRLQRRIFIRRDYEPETEIVLARLFRSAHRFIDIGANIGYYSLMGRAVNPQMEIISFEPLPANVKQFQQSMSLNGVSGIQLIEKCVGEGEGTVEFLIPPGDECGWGRIAYRDLFNGEKIQRSVVTLQSLASQIDEKTVIKMDVEGFERDVIRGGRDVLANRKPVICVEMNEACFKDMGFSSADLFREIQSLGFELAVMTDDGNLDFVTEPRANYSAMNYIAVHPERRGFWKI